MQWKKRGHRPLLNPKRAATPQMAPWRGPHFTPVSSLPFLPLLAFLAFLPSCPAIFRPAGGRVTLGNIFTFFPAFAATRLATFPCCCGHKSDFTTPEQGNGRVTSG